MGNPAFPPIPDISLRRTAWRAISQTRDEARRIAANIAKLPGVADGRLLGRPALAAPPPRGFRLMDLL